MQEIEKTAIEQQLVNFRRLNNLREDAESIEFDAAFSVALIQCLKAHNIETKEDYIKQGAHLFKLNHSQIDDAELQTHLVEKFIRHIILRLKLQIRLRNQANLIVAMNQAVNDELAWYNTISDNNLIVAPGVPIAPVDRLFTIASVIPRGTDDIATIASRAVKFLAQFFRQVFGNLAEVKDGFGFANVGIQALAFLYFPFIYIYKGAIKKDYSVLNKTNHIFWGITGVILVLTCLATFPPAAVLAPVSIISIFTIALSVGIYRIVSNYLDRQENRNALSAIKFTIPILQNRIAHCEHDMVNELIKQHSDPAVIQALKNKRTDLCQQLQNQLHQKREMKATRKELENPYVKHGNKLRVFASSLTLIGAILVIGGPVTMPAGIALLSVAGALALVIFFAQQIKQYRLNREIEADKQQDKQLILPSTTNIFVKLNVSFTEHHSHSQPFAPQGQNKGLAGSRPSRAPSSEANDNHAYKPLSDDENASFELHAFSL